MNVVQTGAAYNLPGAQAETLLKGTGSPGLSAGSAGGAQSAYSADSSHFSMDQQQQKQQHKVGAGAGAGHAQWDEAAWVWDPLGMEALPSLLTVDKSDPSEVSSVPGASSEGAAPEDPKDGRRKVKSIRKQKTQSGVCTVGGAGKDAAKGAKDLGGPAVCQIDNCGADLSEMGPYNRRYKVCYTCLKQPLVKRGGVEVRFCQQCSCFHEMSAFDGKKRSCREQLDKHNKRRRERMETAAKKVMAADPTSDLSLAAMLSGDAKKRACRPIMPMDSVSSENLFTPNGSFGFSGTSFSGGSLAVTPAPRVHVANDDTAFVQAVDNHAAVLAAEQGTASCIQAPGSGQSQDVHRLLQGMDLDSFFGDTKPPAISPPPPPPPIFGSQFAAALTGAQAVTSGMTFSAPSSGDISTVRQLATNDSVFVMPRASDPLVMGPGVSESQQQTMEQIRLEISSGSTTSVTSGMPVGAGAFAQLPPRPVLQHLSSFDKWAAAALADEPSPMPTLASATSVDKFWNSLEAGMDLASMQPDQPHTQPGAPLAAGNVSAVANSMATATIGGPQISLSEQIIQDALEMLDNTLAHVYPEPKDELVRLSFKMFDREPSDLSSDVRQRLGQSAPGGMAQDGYLQQGCTHLVVDLLAPNDHTLTDPAVLSHGLSTGTLAGLPAGAAHFFSGSGVVQGPAGASVRIEGGKVVATCCGGGRHMTRVLGSETPVLCCGSGEHLVTIYAIHSLSTGPVTQLQAAVRHAGAYVDASVLSATVLGMVPSLREDSVLVRMQLGIPVDALGEGLVLVEVVNQGVLSAALPLVATSDHGIAKELLQLGPGRPLAPIANGGQSDTTARLISDIGMVLDWGASPGTFRDRSEQLAPDALQAYNSSLAGRARSALLVAAERGWASVASAILDATQADGTTPAEAYEAIDAMRSQRGAGLLHAAIRGGNLFLMSLVLDWAADAGVSLPVAESRHAGSASPLHLAALLEDGGAMVELLLQHAAPGDSARQYELWAAPGTGGASPEAIASKCRRHDTVERMSLKRQRAGAISEDPEEDIQPLCAVAAREVQAVRPGETWVEADQSQLAKARKLWAAEQKRARKPVLDLNDDDWPVERMDSAKGYDYTPGGSQSPVAPPETHSAPVAVATTVLPEVPEDNELGNFPPSDALGTFSDRYIAIPRTDSARDEQDEDSGPVEDTPQGDGKMHRGSSGGYAGRRNSDAEKPQMGEKGFASADQWPSQASSSTM